MKHTIHNTITNPEEVMHEYGLECNSELDLTSKSLVAERSKLNNEQIEKFDAIVLGLAHKQFLNLLPRTPEKRNRDSL